MKIKVKILTIIFLLIFFQALPGKTPQKRENARMSLMPILGIHSGYEFGMLLPLPNTSDVPEITVQSKSQGLRIGFSLGYQISKYIEFQGMFMYGLSEFQEDVGIGLAGIPLGITKVSDVKFYATSGNILYLVPFDILDFYVTGGVGAVTSKPEKLETKTKLMLNFGAGLRAEILEHVRVFLDFRDFVSFFNYSQDFGVLYPAMYEQLFNKSQHSLGIHFGLGYLF